MARDDQRAEGAGEAGVGSGRGIPQPAVEAPTETGPGRSPEELALIAMDVLLNSHEDEFYFTEGREAFKELYEHVYGKGSYDREGMRVRD